MLTWLTELLQNRTLICSVCAWFSAQAIKYLVTGLRTKKWSLRPFFAAGGMPSSHTSAVSALACMVGLSEGFSSPLFAGCVVFASIVMYDATGVRRETGKQGSAINRLLQVTPEIGPDMDETRLKERMGHNPLEVIGGCLLGILFAALFTVL